MGVLSSLLAPRPQEVRAETSGVTSPAGWLLSALGGGPTASGKTVSPASALTLSAVYAAVRLISMSVATLPLHVYRSTERGKDRVRTHALERLLNKQPNRWQTALEFRSMLQGHACLRGNGFAWIDLSNGGDVLGLRPLHPDRVQVWITKEETPAYTYHPIAGGPAIPIPASEMLHLRGFGGDGYVGYSVVTLAREALGLSMAAEEHQARFYANDATPGGLLSHPSKMSPEAKQRLRASWESRFSGSSNSHRVAVLEEGMKFERMTLTATDQQFIESRSFSVTDVARWFGVPPHKIADLSRSTNNNIEHQALEFLREGIGPWLEAWEQAVWRDCLGPGEQRTLYVEHNADAFLRGDTLSRYRAHAIGRQNGWLSVNDIRAMENQNPLDGEQGDVYLVPTNMIPADRLLDDPPPGDDDASGGAPPTTAGDSTPQVRQLAAARDAGLLRAAVPALADVGARCSRRVTGEVERAERRGVPMFESESLCRAWWAEAVYREHGAFVARTIEPIAATLALATRPDADAELVVAEARAFALAAGERVARAGVRVRAGGAPEPGTWEANEARRLIDHFRAWSPPTPTELAA